MKFEPLRPNQHNRKDFDCGVDALNLYLQRFANQDQKRSLARVTVLSEAQKIIGFYSISAHSVSRDELPEDITLGNYSDIPFLLLGRLAVDKAYQGQGFGDTLVFHAFKTTTDAAEKVGIVGMIVDAKDEQAAAFYKGFGFRRLSLTRNRLVLPLSAIAQLL